MTPEQTQVLAVLKTASRELPIGRKTIARITNFNERRVRMIFAELQSQGIPVISLDHGYYLGAGEELEAYKRREIHRAVSILQKLKGLVPQAKEALRQLELSF